MQVEETRKYIDPIKKCSGCGNYTANNTSRIIKNARCVCARNISNK